LTSHIYRQFKIYNINAILDDGSGENFDGLLSNSQLPSGKAVSAVVRA